MKIIVSSDNMQVTESMKVLSEKKLQKFSRYLAKYDPETVVARVVLNSAPNEQFTAKLHLDVKGTSYFNEETDFDLETALIGCIDQLERKYEKDKESHELRWKEQRTSKEQATDLATEV